MSASPIPGFKPRAVPDRYPTRESWPAPGTRGTHNGRPVTLMTVYFQYYALFQTGRYSVMRANLQDFETCE